MASFLISVALTNHNCYNRNLSYISWPKMNGHSFYNIRKRTLGMKNIGNIFKTDMKNIGTNWVAAILIGGLILLPSLYAWVNIKAMWDPYSQTDQISEGIVKEDTGSMLSDKEIDAGDGLVDSYRKR